MSRTLSSVMGASTRAAQTEQIYLLLVTVSHASLGTPLRYVQNNENVTSRGNVFSAWPFDVTLFDEADDRPPEVELLIDNVNREPLATLRALTSPPTVTIEAVLASSPNTLEVGPVAAILRVAPYDGFTVRGTLTFEPVLSEPYPGYVFDPRNFPAAF